MACSFCISGEIWEVIGFHQPCPNWGITYEEWRAEIFEEEGKDKEKREEHCSGLTGSGV